MASKELERYREILTRIIENSSAPDRHQTEQLTIAPDEVDVAVANHSLYIANVQEGLERSIRAAAREALVRLEEGEYGRCIECDGPISPKRLKAVPWTDHCLVCQEALENALGKAA